MQKMPLKYAITLMFNHLHVDNLLALGVFVFFTNGKHSVLEGLLHVLQRGAILSLLLDISLQLDTCAPTLTGFVHPDLEHLSGILEIVAFSQ